MFKKLTEIKKVSLIRRICISIGIFLVVFMMEIFGIVQVVDNYIFDLVYMQDKAIDLPITIIGIDENTLNELGNYNDWDRGVYADLLDVLCTDEYAPATICFDIVYTGSKDSESDKRFAEKAAEYGRCVFATRLEFEDAIVDNQGVKHIDTAHISSVGRLYDELEAINPITGFSNNTPVYDKYIRTFIPYFSTPEYTGDSLAYAAYKVYCEQNGITPIDFSDEKYRQFRFSYSGGPESFETVGLDQVLSGEISANSFKNKIVLVGAHANGFQDDFSVPSDHTSTMYGVEIHANIMEAMFDGAYQTDGDYTVMGIVYGILGALIFFIFCFFSLGVDAVIMVLVVGGNLLVGRICYGNGLVIDQFSFFIAVVLSYIGMVIHHYIKANSSKRKLSKAFKMYVAPQIVDEVAGKGDYEINLGGRNKDIAVLFIDIRGFTTMSENLRPEEVVNILNEYFAIVTDAVFKNKGTLDKFIGDAAMAVFNSPFDLEDYVYRAVHTGWDIATNSQKLADTLMEKYGRTISYGIGINCGEAVIGNIGCEFRMDYTAIGDTVNTSSRLESNAKAGQILISQEVRDRLGDRITVEEIGEIPLKGKSKSICVYNVTGIVE